MSEDLTLYTNPTSRGRIARWMLEETGAPYAVEVLSYDVGIRSAAYLAINPMGKVPAIRHGDAVVTETPAICAYLADAFPAAGLAPPTQERGAYYRWLFFGAGPLEAASVNTALGFHVSPEQEGLAGYGRLDKVLDTLERALADSAHITGERFCAADVYVGAVLNVGVNLMHSIEARPVFVDYLDRLKSREAFVRAGALDDALMAGQGT